jgi:hypothetical protein
MKRLVKDTNVVLGVGGKLNRTMKSSNIFVVNLDQEY